jgi:hypothetical protein
LLILEFEIGGKKYQMKHGAFRNNISRLMKRGEVERAFKSRPSFYSVPSKKFNKMMTLGRMGGARCNCRLISSKANPIYRWLKTRHTEKQSLHNNRLTFESNGICNVFSKIYKDSGQSR